MKLEAIIGLEIHVQLKTKSKMFCSCDNDGEHKLTNTTVCPVCLGHPGTLPVPNQQALSFAIRAGHALNCEVAPITKFDRKNYFYPDLPKGYQISQFDVPICEHGHVDLMLDEKTGKRIGITRLHMEEDAGKNTHTAEGTLVDFNRGGTPLIEIVTEPDFRSSLEAKIFLQELRAIMRYLGISDADMEKGHLRCDANISLRPVGQEQLYPKTEIKNINSFKSVERALEYEIKRQTELWKTGNAPSKQETRGWDDSAQITKSQRTKEDAQDYRYFPEPDIPHITVSPELIAQEKSLLPELPFAKRQRFYSEYNLPFEIINQLVLSKSQSQFFEQIVSELKDWLIALDENKNKAKEAWEEHKAKILKLVSGWYLSKYPSVLQKFELTHADKPITAENFAELLSLLFKKALNQQAGLTILEKIIDPNYDGKDPSQIMNDLGLAQLDNSAEIEAIATQVIFDNQDKLQAYKAGKETLFNFFLGQVMKESKGKANPQSAREILEKLLND